MMAPNRCLMCKGARNLCGNYPCPLLAKMGINPLIQGKVSEKFFGPSSSIFVGRFGYPNVFVGPTGFLELREGIDNPASWFGKGYKEIIEARSLALRGESQKSVFSKDKFILDNQLITLSQKPVDIEMAFKAKPIYEMKFSDIHQPAGPIGKISAFKLVDNVHVPRKVDATISDELKASEASFQLYKVGEDVYKLTNILSSGALGAEEKKKLVPTRWSITAVDDLITKNLLEEVKQSPTINEYLVFESTYMDNHFLILLMPGNFEFENFEAWAPGSSWSQGASSTQVIEEYEPFQGRKSYADKQAGGYYAARLGIVELLHRIKRQARVVSIREISKGYVIPLGVWVVRETVRNAMTQKPIAFSNLAEALNHISSKLKNNVQEYISRSVLLKQKRLFDFF